MRHSWKVLLVAVCLAGCSSKEVVTDKGFTQRSYDNANTIGRDGTLTWHEDELSGAAYNQASYHHVLAKRNTEMLKDYSPEPVETLLVPSKPDEAIKVVEQTILRSYSVYELSRWRRFCGEGKMDEKDWDFVSKEGRGNVPENILIHCTPPSFSRQDYINAWKASCGKQPVSSAQRVIQNKTIRPKGICGA